MCGAFLCGKTGFASDKRPDFLLHINRTKDDIEAKVVIEVKRHMKNGKQIHANFVQGRSYAKWGAADVLVSCDMKRILVYRRNDKNITHLQYQPLIRPLNKRKEYLEMEMYSFRMQKVRELFPEDRITFDHVAEYVQLSQLTVLNK